MNYYTKKKHFCNFFGKRLERVENSGKKKRLDRAKKNPEGLPSG